MKRREFLGTLGVVAALPLAAQAAQPTNIPRLCFLTFDPAASRTTRFDAFFQALRDVGYEDGKTISIDYLSAHGNGERFPSLAAECMRLNADIIAVSTTPATQAAKADQIRAGDQSQDRQVDGADDLGVFLLRADQLIE